MRIILSDRCWVVRRVKFQVFALFPVDHILTKLWVISNYFALIIIIIIIYSLEFFTSVLTDALSLEFEWQQVSSSLQDSSQYSGRSQ